MKRLIATFALGVCLSACSNPVAPTSETRLIGLSGGPSGNSSGNTFEQPLTITNNGNATLTVTGITFAPGATSARTGFAVNWGSGTIVPGGSQVAIVTFSPIGDLGYYWGVITVTGDQTSGTNAINVSGVWE